MSAAEQREATGAMKAGSTRPTPPWLTSRRNWRRVPVDGVGGEDNVVVQVGGGREGSDGGVSEAAGEGKEVGIVGGGAEEVR